MSMTVSRPVGALRSGDHACLTFASDVQQREALTRFVARGLAGREKVYCFVDTDLAAVPQFLQAAGVAAGDALNRGQLVLLSAEEAYLPGRSFDPEAMIALLRQLIDAAVGEGYAGLRLAAEMTWMLRSGLDAEAIAFYERTASTVFSSRPGCAMCHYDRRRFPAELVAAVEAAHPYVATTDPLYADELLTLTPVYDPAGLRVAGDIDLSNTAAWQSALAAVADRADEVRLDLAGLGFIDVQGVRALARTAADMADGHCLVVDSAPPELLRMLRLSGWDRITGLVIGAR
jgi:anti-anti-sigma factor